MKAKIRNVRKTAAKKVVRNTGVHGSSPARRAATRKATAKKKVIASGNKRDIARTAAKRSAPKTKKSTRRGLSPRAKKNLAIKHLWKLVAEKKRRTAKPPAWQMIVHHDRAAHSGRSSAAADAPLASPAVTPFVTRGHRDLGSG